MNWEAYQADLSTIWPEITLSITVVLALVFDLLLRGRDTRVTGWVTILGTVFALYFVCDSYPEATGRQAFGLLTHDSFAMFFKLLLGSGLLVVLLLSVFFRGLDRDGVGEYYAVLTTAVLGGFFLVSTTHMLMMYLALETLSLSSYIMAGFLKRERRGSEAAIKYLVYGVLSTGCMLYGMSLLFGFSGSLEFAAIGAAVQTHLQGTGALSTEGIGVVIALVLVLVGFGYKVAAFPFHSWSPDVYEGAPTPVTTFLAVISKVASFGMILRFLSGVVGDSSVLPAQIVALMAAASMFYGNLGALLQDNAKRLLAYSSIAHSGYLLMGVAAMLTPGTAQAYSAEYGASLTGGQAVAFYLAAYVTMNLGAFAVVMYFSNRYGIESISRYNGLGWKAPMAGAMLTIFLLSLTGIPPTVGFIGKWYLFLPVLDKGLYWLAVVAGINSVISLFYYFRMVKALFLKGEEEVTPSARTHAFHWSLITLVTVLGLLTVYLGIAFGSLSELVRELGI